MVLILSKFEYLDFFTFHSSHTFDTQSLENGMTYNVSLSAVNHLNLTGKTKPQAQAGKGWLFGSVVSRPYNRLINHLTI